jgi:hypothetical protein
VSRLALDFNKVNNKNYQLYRVLQTSDIWSKIYRNRIERFSGYKTSIVFPESLLGLNQVNVYAVVEYADQIGVVAAAIPMYRFKIYDIRLSSENGLRDLEQIEAFERATSNLEFSEQLCFRFNGLRLPFGVSALFSSKKDAGKYASKLIVAKINGNL